ncbi:MAG: hypothetical protein WKG07_10965 [Hymenobacter sp.]
MLGDVLNSATHTSGGPGTGSLILAGTANQNIGGNDTGRFWQPDAEQRRRRYGYGQPGNHESADPDQRRTHHRLEPAVAEQPGR